MNYVIDASAIVAYLEGEPGGDAVAALLSDPASVCYAHSVNLCEVYYPGIRRRGAPRAQAAVESLYADGVVERRDMSRRFWQRVGDLKARGHISLPDCFCICLAEVLRGQVVTCEHGEFGPIVDLDIVPIEFIR